MKVINMVLDELVEHNGGVVPQLGVSPKAVAEVVDPSWMVT